MSETTAKGKPTIEQTTKAGDTEPIGLLPHEASFVLTGLEAAWSDKKEADAGYTEAVANSGGDWAFDDGASVASAFHAHITDHGVNIRARLAKLRTIKYPAPDSPAVAIGSRVVFATTGWTDTYDLTSHRIPDMPVEEDVELLSAQTPLGSGLIGKEVGDMVSWSAPAGELSGTVVSIDQEAQRRFYESLAEPAA